MDMGKVSFLPKYLPHYVLKVNKDVIKSKSEYVYSSYVEFQKINKNIKIGDYIIVKNKDNVIYVVKPLDNFEKIAKEFGVTVSYIREKNKIEKLFIGQQLII